MEIPEEEASGTPEPDSTAYEDFEGHSIAYKWLVGRFGSYDHPSDQMHVKYAIRAIMHDSVRAPRGSPRLGRRRAQQQVHLVLHIPRWNPIDIARSHGFEPPLTDVLHELQCLTGSWQEAQLTTIADYINQSWPATTEPLLSVLTGLLGNQGKGNIYGSHSSQSTFVQAHLENVDLCVFKINGTPRFVTNIVEQLAWVTSALQARPKAAWIVEYVPKLLISAQSKSGIGSYLSIYLNARLEVSVEDTRVRENKDKAFPRGSSRNFGLVSGFPIMENLSRKPGVVQPYRLTPGYDIRMLLLPTSLQEVIDTVPKRLIKVTSEDQPQLLNDCKLLIECYTGCLWDWWPFKSPLHPVNDEKRRIEWTMFGYRLQFQTTKTSAHLLESIVADMSSHPVRCHCCVPGIPRNSWTELSLEATSSLLSLIHVRSRNHGNPSAAAQRYTPVTHISDSAQNSSTTAQPPSTNASSVVSIQNSDSAHGLINSQHISTTHQRLQLLFGVQGLHWSLELEPILLPKEPCDSTLFKSLRTFHRLYRPVLLHWLSPFRFKICRCVKLAKASVRLIISSTAQELPDDARYAKEYASKYEYFPRGSDATPPLIDPRMYQILLSECHKPCYWTCLPWHYCIRLYEGGAHITKLPKLKSLSSPLRRASDVAFGLEADYMLSLRILAAYHVLTIVPAFVFWGYWMARHPGDLQNASVPLMTVLALITVFWIMMGKRVGIS